MHSEQHGGVVHDHLLGLLVERDALGYIAFGTGLFKDGVQRGVGVAAVVLLRARVEEHIREVLRVGVIGAPAAIEDLAVVARIDRLEIVVRLDVLDRDGHAEVLLPHLDQGGHICADVAAKSPVGVDDGRQVRAILGLLEQVARRGGIVGQALERDVESRQPGRIQADGGQRMSAHDHVDVLLAIEGHAEGLAHVDVVEGRAGVIEDHVTGAQVHAREQFVVQRLGRVGEALDGIDTGDVHLARFVQALTVTRVQVDDHVRDGRCAEVEVGVGLIDHALEAGPLDQLVRSRAVGLAVPLRA